MNTGNILTSASLTVTGDILTSDCVSALYWFVSCVIDAGVPAVYCYPEKSVITF